MYSVYAKQGLTMPNTTKSTAAKSQFKSPIEIKHILELTLKAKKDYPFQPTMNAGSVIENLLLPIAKSDEKLDNFNALQDCVQLIIEIERLHNRIASFPNDALAHYLNVYSEHVSAMQDALENLAASESIHIALSKDINILDNFYRHLGPGSAMHTFCYKNDGNALQSIGSIISENTLAKSFKQIIKLQKFFQAFKSSHASIIKQESLVELFGKYLSNDLPQNPIAKRTPTTAEGRSSKEIFPNTWPAYANDPEATVPISETIQTIAGKDRESLFKLFCAEQLTHDFKKAFPWAIKPNAGAQSHHPSERHPAVDGNLLGTKDPLEKQLQVRVVQFVLLSIDLIGKAVGVKGDKIVEQFDLVDEMIHNLETVSESLETEPIDQKNLKAAVDNRLEKTLSQQSKILTHQDKHHTLFANPIVNAFCHANEMESFKLLKLDNVAPIVPSDVGTKGVAKAPLS